ncbi:MAG TPA: questin oxidase family protein [Burkholderiaceae bacterium]|nr:questin oxidase family protein [Burkholderiaceae bacterium]
MTAASLRLQLADASRFDAEYGASLSNHLPMALTALARLGADDARLAAFAARYAQRLHAAPALERWPTGMPWRAQLGDPRAWPAYRSLMREWIAFDGAPMVLGQVLPTLMEGVGAAAFHGLIRTAYALTANHADELADALAYWACRWFRCGAPPQGGAQDDPAPVLAALEGLAAPRAPLIAQAMALAAAQPRFASALAGWRVDEGTLPRLALRAAERYVAEGGFTGLHLVTSAHAMQVVLPWCDSAADRAGSAGHYAVAFAAAWATLGRTAVSAATPVRILPDWGRLAALAAASDDDHVVKLVDSARELERLHGGSVWQHVAARAVTRGV